MDYNIYFDLSKAKNNEKLDFYVKYGTIKVGEFGIY